MVMCVLTKLILICTTGKDSHWLRTLIGTHNNVALPSQTQKMCMP